MANPTPEEWARQVVGRRIVASVSEPSDVGERPGTMTGDIARVLYFNSPQQGGKRVRDRYLLALIRLDTPQEWEPVEPVVFRVISICSRSSFTDLNEMEENVGFPVNVGMEPDWLLQCSSDDPRIPARFAGADAERARWAGYGGARLA